MLKCPGEDFVRYFSSLPKCIAMLLVSMHSGKKCSLLLVVFESELASTCSKTVFITCPLGRWFQSACSCSDSCYMEANCNLFLHTSRLQMFLIAQCLRHLWGGTMLLNLQYFCSQILSGLLVTSKMCYM